MADTTPATRVHALLAPSSSHQWSRCAAAPLRQKDAPDTSGEPAWWGTVAHGLSERALIKGNTDNLPKLDGKWAYAETLNGEEVVAFVAEKPKEGLAAYVDDEMFSCVKTYVNFVQDLVAETGGELFVEQRFSIEHITKEKDACGTCDAVIITPDELIIVDLKTGMVDVSASEEWAPAPDELGFDVLQDAERKPNTQLLMYASGAYEQHKLFEDFQRVRLIIVQPRTGNIDQHVLSINEFTRWVTWLSIKAGDTQVENPKAIPGEKQCRYCRVQSTCPELQQEALNAAFGDFDDLNAAEPQQVADSQLATIYRKLPLIKAFCAGVEDRVFRELQQGNAVADTAGGYKLIETVAGHRKWADPVKAEKLLKGCKLKPADLYKKTLITPTQAEALLKKPKPEQWAQAEALITRGGPSLKIVDDSDPRPPVASILDDFDVIDQPDASVSNLFD